MSERQFDEVHLFLDESGDLVHKSTQKDVLLVGGVLLFGSYDTVAEKQLQKKLKQRLAEAGGRFPRDLHFFGHDEGKGLSFRQRHRFLQRFDEDLRQWCGTERLAYGMSLRHDEDVFSRSSGILSERYFDNRYLSMLWSLVEHLLFVDDGIRRQLSPRAEAHLHIANRGYSFNPAEMPTDWVESLGYSVKDDEWHPGNKFVTSSLRRREVATMMRMARRHRWGEMSPTLRSVEVTSIKYHDGESSPLLYLADLYLGTVRLAERSAKRAKHAPARGMVLMDTLRRLRYDVGMELIAAMQAALLHGNLEHYLELFDDYQAAATRHDFSANQEMLHNQEPLAADLARSSHESLIHLAESAATEVDLPGSAGVGLAKAQLAERLLMSANIDDFHARMLLLQTRLSHANHTGDIQEADKIWEEYQSRETDLPRLGPDGLRFKAMIRNRRAVSLIDHFRHEDALETLSHVVSEREEFLLALARLYGMPVEDLPSQQLAECLGSLGQAHCFVGEASNMDLAEHSFRRASNMFTDPHDIQRQWIYLGHLACDRGENGRDLWRETCSHIPELVSSEPIARSSLQYLFALQLKGVLLFSNEDALIAFTDRLVQSNPLRAYTAEDKRFHPFGLIRQAMGMLYARAWHSNASPTAAEVTLRHFDAAIQHMKSGGGLLQLLAYIARLRRELFALEVDPKSSAAKRHLRTTLATIKGYGMELFGDPLWSEDDEGRNHGYLGKRDPGAGAANPLSERAAGVVAGIRFNYW